MALPLFFKEVKRMSNAEHAIENAVVALEKNIDYETWASNDLNLENLQATPDEIWNMAQWVLYNYRPLCQEEIYKEG